LSHLVAPEKQAGRKRSALELHARYFDPDHDEAVTPKQTLKGMTDLGLGSTGTSARALDMNGSGLVAGYLGLQAFRWSATGGLDLLGSPEGWANSFAFAINASGQVAGSASGAFGNAEVVARYTDGTGWKILGGRGEHNVGNGINQWGDVVGTGLLGSLRQGLIYTDNLGLLAMIDDLLFIPGSWRIMQAYDINDAQQITGWAIDNATGLRSAVLLTPVSPPPLNQPPVAKFFDDVLVMAEDERLRAARLGLIATLRGLILDIADISEIVTE